MAGVLYVTYAHTSKLNSIFSSVASPHVYILPVVYLAGDAIVDVVQVQPGTEVARTLCSSRLELVSGWDPPKHAQQSDPVLARSKTQTHSCNCVTRIGAYCLVT